jgi:hypothetical protein
MTGTTAPSAAPSAVATPPPSPSAPARVADPELVKMPVHLLDEVPLGHLATLRSLRSVITAVGFTIHYWRPSAPGSAETYIEVIAEHRDSRVWVAKRINDQQVNRLSAAVGVLEDFLNSSIYPASGSLPGLAHTMAGVACSEWRKANSDRTGESWTEGGLLLGCLRLLDHPGICPDGEQQAAAVRTVLALLDPDLLTLVDRLACWQDSVQHQRSANENAARDAYYEAVLALWPALGEPGELAADQISRSIRPDRLLSLPRPEWPTAAPQAMLDMLANHEKWVFRHLGDAWGKAGLGEFTSVAALEAAKPAAATMPGVRVPASLYP